MTDPSLFEGLTEEEAALVQAQLEAQYLEQLEAQTAAAQAAAEADAQAAALAQAQAEAAAAAQAEAEAAAQSAERTVVEKVYIEDCGQDTGYWKIAYSDGTVEFSDN